MNSEKFNVKPGQRWKKCPNEPGNHIIIEILTIMSCVYCENAGFVSAKAIVVDINRGRSYKIGDDYVCHNLPKDEDSNMYWEYLCGQDRVS